MRTTIEKLWNGELAPLEACGAKDPQIDELVQLIERNKADLLKELDDSQRETLHKLMACEEEYTYLITQCAFSDGFRLAGKLLTEVLA